MYNSPNLNIIYPRLFLLTWSPALWTVCAQDPSARSSDQTTSCSGRVGLATTGLRDITQKVSNNMAVLFSCPDSKIQITNYMLLSWRERSPWQPDLDQNLPRKHRFLSMKYQPNKHPVYPLDLVSPGVPRLISAPLIRIIIVSTISHCYYLYSHCHTTTRTENRQRYTRHITQRYKT